MPLSMTFEQHFINEQHFICWSTLVQAMACCLIAPHHNLEQYWLIVNCIHRKQTSVKILLKFEPKIFVKENAFENDVWQMLAILLSQCVNTGA